MLVVLLPGRQMLTALQAAGQRQNGAVVGADLRSHLLSYSRRTRRRRAGKTGAFRPVSFSDQIIFRLKELCEGGLNKHLKQR